MAVRSERASENDFGLLGLSAGAPRGEVKAAYRRLAKEWHPDRYQQRSWRERERAEEKFKELTAAYRRIAGGWLEDERSSDKRPSTDSASSDRHWATGRESAGDQHFARRTSHSSTFTHRRRGLLSTTLLLVVLVCLIAIRSHFSTIHPERPSSQKAAPAEVSRPPDSSAVGGGQAAGPSPPPISEFPPREGESPILSPPRPFDPGRTSKSPSRGPLPEFISIGSTQEEVLRIQGPPQVVRGQTWVYGVSELGFKEGRVVRYNNFDGSLRVRVLPSRHISSPILPFYTIGSSMDEVLAVQGTPTRMEGNRWLYGFSEIRFKDGKLEEYDNFFGDLKIQLTPGEARMGGLSQRSFTIGSTDAEVLLAQGTPTSIRGNLWYYQMSSILFRKGKVHYVFNTSGNLRFVPKEELTRSK